MRTTKVKIGMDSPPGDKKEAGYDVSLDNLNLIAAKATPTYKNRVEIVAKTSNCLNPPEKAIRNEMSENAMIVKCGVAYLGCTFDKNLGSKPSLAPANMALENTNTMEFKLLKIAITPQAINI